MRKPGLAVSQMLDQKEEEREKKKKQQADSDMELMLDAIERYLEIANEAMERALAHYKNAMLALEQAVEYKERAEYAMETALFAQKLLKNPDTKREDLDNFLMAQGIDATGMSDSEAYVAVEEVRDENLENLKSLEPLIEQAVKTFNEETKAMRKELTKAENALGKAIEEGADPNSPEIEAMREKIEYLQDEIKPHEERLKASMAEFDQTSEDYEQAVKNITKENKVTKEYSEESLNIVQSGQDGYDGGRLSDD